MDLMSPTEAAAYVGKSSKTLDTYAAKGLLMKHKANGRVYFDRAELEAFRTEGGGPLELGEVVSDAAPTEVEGASEDASEALARWEAPEVWLARFEATARRLGQAEGERDTERARAERAEAEGRRLQEQLQQQSGLIAEANRELARSEEQLIEARARLARHWWEFWRG